MVWNLKLLNLKFGIQVFYLQGNVRVLIADAVEGSATVTPDVISLHAVEIAVRHRLLDPRRNDRTIRLGRGEVGALINAVHRCHKRRHKGRSADI